MINGFRRFGLALLLALAGLVPVAGALAQSDLPAITNFSVDPVPQLSVGTVLIFRATGTAGGQLVLDIDGVPNKLGLVEVSTGKYAGSYTIGIRDRIASDGKVKATLRRGSQQVAVVLGLANKMSTAQVPKEAKDSMGVKPTPSTNVDASGLLQVVADFPCAVAWGEKRTGVILGVSDASILDDDSKTRQLIDGVLANVKKRNCPNSKVFLILTSDVYKIFTVRDNFGRTICSGKDFMDSPGLHGYPVCLGSGNGGERAAYPYAYHIVTDKEDYYFNTVSAMKVANQAAAEKARIEEARIRKVQEEQAKQAAAEQTVQTRIASATPALMSGSSPFKADEVENACRQDIKGFFDSSFNGSSRFKIEKIEFLPSVKPEESGLPAIAVPKTDRMYPAKIFVYNGKLFGPFQVMLWKTPFGIECRRV